jgi:NAD(P)-dependent dehydrogenase (short-subunit alcohol dehydrogenase family)
MAFAAGQPAEVLLDRILAGQVVPDLLEADKVAGAFLFLACDDASAITGQSIIVSHGQVML